jgi:hypothetical protein
MFIISTQYKDLSTSFISTEQSWQGSVLVYKPKIYVENYIINKHTT